MHSLWGTALSRALKTFFLPSMKTEQLCNLFKDQDKLIKVPNSEFLIYNLKEKPQASLKVL